MVFEDGIEEEPAFTEFEGVVFSWLRLGGEALFSSFPFFNCAAETHFNPQILLHNVSLFPVRKKTSSKPIGDAFRNA